MQVNYDKADQCLLPNIVFMLLDFLLVFSCVQPLSVLLFLFGCWLYFCILSYIWGGLISSFAKNLIMGLIAFAHEWFITGLITFPQVYNNVKQLASLYTLQAEFAFL